MFENPRRGRQVRNFTTNVPKILVLKWSSEQIFSRKLPLGAPALSVHSLSVLNRFGEDHERTADSYSQLSVKQYVMHDYTLALQSHQRTLAIRVKVFGEEHERTADN